MMLETTLAKLNQLKLYGIVEALTEQNQSTLYAELPFEDRLGLLVDREITARDNRRLTNLLRGARLRYSNACTEEIDFRTPRGLAKDVIISLAQNGWLKGKQNVIITGPTGSGKTFMACALANSACRSGHSAYYIRLPRLLQEMNIARGDGSYGKLLTRIAKYVLLVIDDWGLAKLNDKERRDLLEILEDRHGISSTIVSSQIPMDRWHDTIGDPTIADAVLDRLVHNAHMITMSMKAESMRKLMSKNS
jgi:DNA replication protein DnaC